MAGDKEGSGGSTMLFVVRYAGAFYFLSYVATVALAGFLTLVEGKSVESSVLPLLFYVPGLVGAAMILLAFFDGARNRDGAKPTFGIISYLWLFFSIVLIVLTAIYVRAQLAFDTVLPFMPEWLALGIRLAAFALLFEVGWGMFFGTRRGWLGLESSPWPFGWLLRNTSPGLNSDGSSDKGGSDDDS